MGELVHFPSRELLVMPTIRNEQLELSLAMCRLEIVLDRSVTALVEMTTAFETSKVVDMARMIAEIEHLRCSVVAFSRENDGSASQLGSEDGA